ncbi:54S ribosomal protein, mitochondrial, partial [Toensbergia leucococca]|nr:54S ribosomal protein, mitochondrial [Toensbergia leucococca]
MATCGLKASGRGLATIAAGYAAAKDPLIKCLTPNLSRSMATETQLPRSQVLQSYANAHLTPPANALPRRTAPVAPDVLTTIYSFPAMEPLRQSYYPANHLHLPLRRDILHRAVVFEGDATRQGTASTKWRDQVHGSGRKIRPQKGTGKARLGDRKSPMLRGGGVAFGPHPRDFSTKLPRKIYDLAWRTALSYRYRRGELILIEDNVDIEFNEPRWIKKILEGNHMGNADGRSLIVTGDTRPNLFEALEGAGEDGRIKTRYDIDVKDLLELGRIVMEECALNWILRNHSSDLDRTVPSA